MIPYGKQDIQQQDIDAVVEVLKSDYLTQGPQVPLFEATINKVTDSQFAVAVNSATSALHIACLALGVGKGDIVWISPITFVASANCALYCDASIEFVDIDAKTYNMSIKALEIKLKQAKKNNQLPKVIIPVHLAGQACDMEKIHQLSIEYKFKIIEDAAHAIGGNYQNKPIGNCLYSDITVFSFHPVKIITTAEGGIATTNNKQLAQKMQLFRSHGITRDSELMTEESHGDWYYQQLELGFNYRMTDLQATLGVSQLTRLKAFINKRTEKANYYFQELQGLPLTLPYQLTDSESSWHLYIIRLQLNKMNKTHQQVFVELRDAGILVNLHYIPIYKQPFHKKIATTTADFPESEKYYQEAISIPLYVNLSEIDQHFVINKLKEILS